MRNCVISLPFKGRARVGHVIARSGFRILPFKGRTEVGMGSYLRAIYPPPSLGPLAAMLALPPEGEGEYRSNH